MSTLSGNRIQMIAQSLQGCRGNSVLFKWDMPCYQTNQTVTLIIGHVRVEGDLKLLPPQRTSGWGSTSVFFSLKKKKYI